MIPISRSVIEGLWLRFQGEQVEVCVHREKRRRILQTLAWFVVTLVLALFTPDIGRVISMIGGLAACFIFVFPGSAPNHALSTASWSLLTSDWCLIPASEPDRSLFNPSQALRNRQPLCTVSRSSTSDLLHLTGMIPKLLFCSLSAPVGTD